MKTGCRAILDCVTAAGTTVQEVDFLAVCTCTGYVCPDMGSRLIAHMGFRTNVQRASIVGLGCAGAVSSIVDIGGGEGKLLPNDCEGEPGDERDSVRHASDDRQGKATAWQRSMG
jgi:hypothetical protein